VGKPRTVPVNGIIRLTALAAVVSGILAGVLIPLGAPPEFDRLIAVVNVYLDTFNPAGSRFGYFTLSWLKYAQAMAAIWFLAFVPPAVLLAYGVLSVKICGLAFSVTALWYARGADGIIYAIALLGPQNIIWVPVCCYVVCGCARQAVGRARARHIMRGTGARAYLSGGAMAGYAYKLLVGLLASAVSAFIETWLTPVLTRFIYLS